MVCMVDHSTRMRPASRTKVSSSRRRHAADGRSRAVARGCKHQGFHSAEGRYDPESQTLRYILVCDSCQAELREIDAQRYRPRYDPHGNDGFLAA